MEGISERPRLARLERSLRRVSPDTWGLIVVLAAVLVANLPYLLDFFDPNPLGPRAGLVSSLVTGRVGGDATIDPNNGFISQAVSHLAVHDLLGLHLPWWNPFAGTGMPLLGETQSAALFPPTLLTAVSNGQLYEHILFELVAGMATLRVLRRIGLGAWAASAGGVAFALNGTFAWLSHATVNPVALLPLLLLGIEHAYDAAREGRHGGWWLLGVAGALSVYAGFPEVAYIDTLMGLAWFAWRCGCLDRPRARELLIKAGISAVTGVLLAAPMLVAMADNFNHADLGLHGGTLLGHAHLGNNALPQLLLPYVYGPIFGFPGAHGELSQLWGVVGGYLSIVVVLLAGLGALSPGRRGLRAVLLGLGLLVFGRIYGLPLFGRVLGLLPGMSEVAFFRYAPPVLELTLVILAALGLDAVARRGERRRVAGAAAAGLGLAVAAALGARPLARSLGSHFLHRPYYWLAVAWGVLMALAVLACALVRVPRLRAPLLAGLLVLDSLAMFIAPEFSAPRAVALDLAPVSYLQGHLGTSRFFTMGAIQPNYGSYFRLASLNLNDFPPERFRDYVHRRIDQWVDPTLLVGNYQGSRNLFAPSPEQELVTNLDGYREAAVAYVLTPVGQTLPTAKGAFGLVFRSPTTLVYRVRGALPYMSAGAGCQVSPDGREAARVSCTRAATLVRRETYFPGWSATVDGRAAPIRPYDGVFQSVTLPPGRHTLEFAFTPVHMAWGGLGFAAGILMLAGGGVSARLRRRRARCGP